MNIQEGDIFTIHGLEHVVIGCYDKYVLLLNNSQSELNGSGNIILVEPISKDNFKVVKDKKIIADVVKNLLK